MQQARLSTLKLGMMILASICSGQQWTAGETANGNGILHAAHAGREWQGVANGNGKWQIANGSGTLCTAQNSRNGRRQQMAMVYFTFCIPSLPFLWAD